MADGQDPAPQEPDGHNFTNTGLNFTDDTEMANSGHQIDQAEQTFALSELALPENNALETTDLEPSISENVNMTENDQMLDLGENFFGQNLAATPHHADEVMPSMTGDLDLDMLNAFGEIHGLGELGEVDFGEDAPKLEPASSQHGDFEYPNVDPIVSDDISPVESAQHVAPADLGDLVDVSQIESAHSAALADLSGSMDVTPAESVRPINLGRSMLGNKKKAKDLGIPPGQANREKLKATQVRLARQFAKKQAAQAVSVPSNTSSQLGADESVSDVFAPSDVGVSADVQPEQSEFEALKAAHLLKKRANTSDIESDVAFLMAQAKENARLRKLVTDEHFEQDPSSDEEGESEGLFVTPLARSPASHAPNSEDGTATDGFFTNSVKTRKRKRKADEPGAMAPPTKKGGKKPKAPTGRSLGAGKNGKALSNEDVERTLRAMQSGVDPAPSNQSKKTKSGRKQPSHQISNVKSMMHGPDVFRDAAAVAGHSNQPGFKANTNRKDHALRDLIASVPQDDKSAAAGDKKFLEDSLKDFTGQGSCKPSKDGTGWQLKGMKCTLKHYQVLGVAFMRRRENETIHPRGGILADEMGLGKTIQMIANIINGKPKQGQPRCTLIVASPALISQWYAEITKFAMTRSENKKHGIQRVIQHRAGYKQPGTEANIKEAIMDVDICLTTYTELGKSYPKAEVPAEITTDRGKADWWKQHFEENKGVFHEIKFLRVVLDEAQQIKNHTSHTSMSCRALKSEYYWAISGTPLVNGISEMYPYLKFLRHPHTGSMRTFQANFCSANDPTGSEKLGVFLRQIIIRRTHKDTLFGARLLDLPTPKQNTIFLEFNAVERTVYEIVKQRFIQRINTIVKKDVMPSQAQYTHIWTMLLRLRQICSHVLLIQDTILDLLEREDFEKLEEITQETAGHTQDELKTLEQLRHVLHEHTVKAAAAATATANSGEAADASDAGVDVDVVPRGSTTSGGLILDLGKKHGKTYPFQKYLHSAAESDEMGAINDRMKCCGCREEPFDAHITSCHHIYCKACMLDLQHAAARAGRPAARCSQCAEQFTAVKMLPKKPTPVASHGTETGRSASEDDGKKKKTKNEPLDWIGQSGGVLPSAKTVACKAQILTWLAESPNCKIIVYTQFLPMIRIMAKVCQGEGWGHLKYSGNMSHTAREKALAEFAEDSTKRVMLMSLKCGGLGLNIVAASRVILMDPWWNDAVEQQAFCRVFRIGQTDETRLTRLCVKQSIDAAMFAVKERKTAEIDKVMQETKVGPRSVQDLVKLFGPNEDDDDGNPGFIFPDEDEDDDEDEVAARYYEREKSTFFNRGGQEPGFMGNDF